jgi:hypothetical protein
MFLDNVDTLNRTSQTVRRVRTLHPGEDVIFAAAATILESGDRAPIGWSIRRFLQVRGNVAVTPHRIFVQSNFLSPMTALWVVVALAASVIAIVFADTISLVLAIVALVLIAQRRPFIRDIPVHMIYEVRFGSARGATGRADIMMISTAEGTLHITTSKPIPATVRILLPVVGGPASGMAAAGE